MHLASLSADYKQISNLDVQIGDLGLGTRNQKPATMENTHTLLNLTDIKELEPLPGYSVRFVHSENLTFAFWDIKKGYAVPVHSHPNEQVVKILEGKLELSLEDETYIMEPGQVLVIPANVEHAAFSHTDCKAIDTFYPVREDYKNL